MSSGKPKALVVTSWAFQILAAAILGQTLFFKFAGAPETKALFDVLGAEPWGRYATAGAELIAVVLLLVPRTAMFGGALGVMILLGAVFSHVTKLGISIDPVALGRPEIEPLAGPSLFIMAVVALISCASVAAIRFKLRMHRSGLASN